MNEKKINLNGPYGKIWEANVKTRPDGSDLLFPHPNHSNLSMRGLHHHLYWDSKRENTIGLAYTYHDKQGEFRREFYIDKGEGWETAGRTDSYSSLKELNQALQARRDIKAAERFSQYLAVRLAINELNQDQPICPVLPERSDSHFERNSRH